MKLEVVKTWCPVTPESSCATCYWNWENLVVGTLQRRPFCHLLPPQCVVHNGNQLIATNPVISEPEQSLCSHWKGREKENG